MVKMQKVIIAICTAGEGNERKTKVKWNSSSYGAKPE
jgi:hypothetical protein